jgi:hypothetical protein
MQYVCTFPGPIQTTMVDYHRLHRVMTVMDDGVSLTEPVYSDPQIVLELADVNCVQYFICTKLIFKSDVTTVFQFSHFDRGACD